ncbi:hypothetical protein DICPUDRAFT_77786 [Dictyostelium purpureum]|uniref:Dolichyl-diphosphooligosaccharide--protein glycosyltransferase subunit 2 n=1 Tax=Dictyostelium purpureum TaxID=5786 RepID=F0ZHM0_DICPU|nr:uncharacterized protein DICPUDRAFT_77786 [Dictyostelium purpureum]EGC36552.1 hypothetical protein DICPUDRAFT_77786 [Dictyostelium purpureum]|eukprot:XP_003286924.1 hypothetical protein DICPUDRAFT_77786 [Dictyostelium purpureum]
MKLLLLLLLSILISINYSAPTFTNRGISSVYSKNDINNLNRFISTQKQGKLYGTDNQQLKDTFYAVGALTRLGESVSDAKTICSTVKEQLETNKFSDIELLYNGVTILSELKCIEEISSASKKIQETLKSKLQNGDLLETTQAVNIVFTLQSAKLVTNDDFDLTSSVKRIVSLMVEDEGTFKSTESDSEGTLLNTAAAYFALARLSHRLDNQEVDKQVAKVVHKMDTVIANAEETTDTLYFTDLQTTASLFHSMLSLASINEKVADFVSAKQVNQIAEYLLKQKNVESLSNAYYLIVGLKKCQKNSVSQPLSLTLEKSIFSPSNLATVDAFVTDIFGQNIPATVNVNKIVSSKAPRSTPVLSDKKMTTTGNKHSIDVSNENLKLGLYNIEFKVVPTDNEDYAEITSTQVITITGSITVDDMKFSFAPKADQLGSPKNSQDVVFGKKLSLVDIPANNLARVFFRINSDKQVFVPQQVGIRFYSPSREIVVPVTHSAESFSYTLTNKEMGKLLGYQSGNYQMDLIVGDQSITPLQWNFGEINLKFSQKTQPTSRYTENQPIVHAFRQPEKRPPQSVSNLFTLLVLSPAAIFLLGIFVVGFNLGKFPTGMGFIWTMGFIASVSSIALLIINYWIHSTMDVTLKRLALLLIPTIFFGHRSMSYYYNKYNTEKEIKKD